MGAYCENVIIPLLQLAELSSASMRAYDSYLFISLFILNQNNITPACLHNQVCGVLQFFFCVFFLRLQVAAVYKDPSVGNLINIVIVKLIVIHNEQVCVVYVWEGTQVPLVTETLAALLAIHSQT